MYGGGGFVEDLPMAKLFRHSPLNAIWEGSGNVIALDILRAASSLPILLQECHRMSGQDAVFDEYLRSLQKDLAYYLSLPADQAARAGRHLADRLALALQAAVVMEYGNPLVCFSLAISLFVSYDFILILRFDISIYCCVVHSNIILCSLSMIFYRLGFVLNDY